MITGRFDTAVGSLSIDIDDGGTATNMSISDIGSLGYDFDQTPESVTVDRVQALYSSLNVTILYQDEYGLDLWERLIDSAITLTDIPALMTINTWDGEGYEFGFKLRIGDISLNQRTGLITLSFTPRFDNEVTIKDVFDDIASGDKVTYKKDSFNVGSGNFNNTREYPATGVKNFIDKALNKIFVNSYNNDIRPSQTNLGSSYTNDIYDNIQSTGSKSQFVIVDLPETDFIKSEDNTIVIGGTGTITFINPRVFSTTIEVVGVGTSFLSQISNIDYINIRSSGQSYKVSEVISDTVLTIEDEWYVASQSPPELETGDELKDYGVVDDTFNISKPQGVTKQPALKALKDLAGIEASFFGTGFSKNFYVNRLRRDVADDVQIDFDTQVVDISPRPFYLSLGTSIVSQRADYRRSGEKQLGNYPATSFDIRQVPNLQDTGSITRGNRNASKELKIELAPAYPCLNKAQRNSDGSYSGDALIGNNILESKLTANGLTAYFQALNSTPDKILIEMTLLGAFTVLPWNTISFDINAPERYANKSFRPTSISYDLKNDTVKVKAYQIDTIINEIVSDLGFNFVFGQQLLEQGLLQSVNAQAGEAVNRIQQALFRTAAQVPQVYGVATQRIDLIITGAGIGEAEPEVGLLKAGDNIILFNPLTLESDRFVVSANMTATQTYVQVEPKVTNVIFPAGSFVYISQRNVTAGVKISENSVRIFNESTTVGTLLVSVKNPFATSLSVRLNERIKAGTDLFLGDRSSGIGQSINVLNSVGPGDVTLNIEPENIDAVAGSILYGSSAQTQAILQVDPFRVLTSVTQGRVQSAIAILNGALPIGTYTSIPITQPQNVSINPSTVIMVQDRTGVTQYFTTTAVSQNLASATQINVVSTTTTVNLESGAVVLEPSWRQTSRINQLSNEIVLKVSEDRVNELISENTAGLIPAENYTFESDVQGFTGSDATFTTVGGESYAEYEVTGTPDPHIVKTSGVSYDADDNPVVTIRIKREAGTSWNARFGWTTDGTNFFTQAFAEPANIDTSFQFATITLSSNVDYTGTITGVKLFLGDTIGDTFFLDSFTIGKFNPQADILADLSQSVATNEANITLTANSINSYVTGTQGLNKIADVTGSYGLGTSYTSVTLNNIRSGASVKNGQILILQNADGNFQQVTVNGDQNPLVSPLLINSVSFSENISNAILFEPSYAATSRITQQAGTLVLKAEVNNANEVTRLAFISLDATPTTGSTIRLRANDIIVDGQTTFLNSLKAGGIAGKTDVNATIRGSGAPTLRNDGTAIQAGDTWIKTDAGNLPHTYDGRSPFSVDGWIRDYTQIDGGVITTGTINANNVAIQNTSGLSPDVKINGTGITILQNDGTNETSISRSVHWINSTNTTNQARLVSYAGMATRNVAIDAAGFANDRAFRFSVRRNIAGVQDLSIGIAGATDDFVTGSAQGDAVVSVSNGILWLNDTVRITSSLTANSLIVGTGANKATISYTTNTARTFTIPNVDASDFVMTAGSQTIIGTKTFAHDTLQVRNTGANGVATLRYGTASANNTYTFAGSSGEVAMRNVENVFTAAQTFKFGQFYLQNSAETKRAKFDWNGSDDINLVVPDAGAFIVGATSVTANNTPITKNFEILLNIGGNTIRIDGQSP
jgi:hypothetical protein